MLRWGMTLEQGNELFGKYLGDWGGDVIEWRFDAVKNGEVVRSVVKGGDPVLLSLEAMPSHTLLREGDTYDMAAVRIRVLDENGNTAPYAQLPVLLTLEGDAELVGPSAITAEGGMCGTYIRTLGRPGRAKLTVSAERAGSVSLEFGIGK